MNLDKYVFLTTTNDGEDKIYAKREDVEDICRGCSGCNGADIEDGCGCLTAYVEICYREKPIFYGRDIED